MKLANSILRTCILTCALACGLAARAQPQTANTNDLKTYRVAIFAPLYLDSVFNENGAYRFAKNFPKFALPGLDFIQGAQIALDSMPVYGGNIRASIFDSKSETEPVGTLINEKRLDSFNLIIGAVKDIEYIQLANFAQSRQIPFISATHPNDGGVADNPFLAIVNSTLKAHCEAIFSMIVQSHGTDRVIMVRRPGAQEDKVTGYFNALNSPDGKPLLQLETVNTGNDLLFQDLVLKLDSTRPNVVIGASLGEDFAEKLAAQCYALKKKYNITLIGMPNWDLFQGLLKMSTGKDFPVYYTSPYYNYKGDQQSRMIQALYKKKYKGNPSDMTYKGFETVFIFARLLSRYPDDFMNHLNDYAYKVFSEYNFKPVFRDKNTIPDYFENKRVYFIRIMNGQVSKAW